MISKFRYMGFLSTLNMNGYLEEIPITSTPIFEGHLYIRTTKKQWKWRLFRFDGTNFTCLSTRRIKSISEQSNVRSLLYSTPKNKDNRLIEKDEIELKYYQLPEWTIDIMNISSISILKKPKQSSLSKCFSIRTFDLHHYIFKAQKQKDLERWLFVLTKMWKFSQTIDQHIQQQIYYLQNNDNVINLNQPEIEQDIVDDNIPLVHSIHQNKNLSDEKINVIEEWRKSLAELMANDPSIKVTTPPPIEPIPDDDTMSIFTDMTSVSQRPKSNLKRKSSKKSIRSIRRNKSNSISPGEEDGQTKNVLKKKRSDDVRNWMKHSHDPSTAPYMNFFQDAATVCHDGCSHENHQQHQQQSMEKLKYHASVRGKKLIQIHPDGEPNLTKPTHRRASMPLSPLLDQSLISPLQFLGYHVQQQQLLEQEKEDMSLADLQKSLRQVSLHDTPSIVAPAVPPHQYRRPTSFYLPNSQLNNNFLIPSIRKN